MDLPDDSLALSSSFERAVWIIRLRDLESLSMSGLSSPNCDEISSERVNNNSWIEIHRDAPALGMDKRIFS